MFKIRVKKLFEVSRKRRNLAYDADFVATYIVNGGEAGFDVFKMPDGSCKLFVPEKHRCDPEE